MSVSFFDDPYLLDVEIGARPRRGFKGTLRGSSDRKTLPPENVEEWTTYHTRLSLDAGTSGPRNRTGHRKHKREL